MKTHSDYLDEARDMDVDDVAALLEDRDKTHGMFKRSAERLNNLMRSYDEWQIERSQMRLLLRRAYGVLAPNFGHKHIAAEISTFLGLEVDDNATTD